IQLREKQKVKRMYGLSEKQFRLFFKRADNQKGITGTNLLVMLERRLDSTVYRMGFVNSRTQGRHFVKHNHFLVNGKKVNIPSYLTKAGDVIEVREKSRKVKAIEDALDAVVARTDGFIEDIYPLAPMQEGLLFHALYDHTFSTYFEQMSYRLNGHLDVEVVKKSLSRLVERHAALRTVFLHNDVERPLQLVMERIEVDFHYEDISHIAREAEAEAFVREFKEKDRMRVFNLDSGVPMRVGLIRRADSEYEFIWSFHHILMDGWCTGILMGEYSEIYDSYMENRTYRLPPIEPYRNYIQWLENRDKEMSRVFWSDYLARYDQLAGIPAPAVPADSNTESLNIYTSFALSPEETLRLKKLAGNWQVTLNTVVRAVWGIILAKYNHTRDVVFGAVVSGRPSEIDGIESMVGLFLNTVPVRIRYCENSTFGKMLQNIQAEAVSSESHHYYPLAEIQSQSELKQNLLDHILAFQNFPISERISEAIEKQGNYGESGEGKSIERNLNISDIDVFEQSNYNFNIIITAGQRLNVEFSYNPLMYEKDLIKKIERDFRTVLGRILEEPGCTVDSIELKQRYYPLSTAQELLITGARNDSGDNNIHSIIHLEGALVPEKLQKAFEQMLPRHYSLGANLGFIGDKPVLMSNENILFQLQRYEAPADEVPGIVENFIQPFALHQAPLLRAGLIKTGERRHLLILDTHCLAADARSHDILVSDLLALYRGEELPVSHDGYREHLQLRRKYCQPELLKEQEYFWTQVFSDYRENRPAALPVDFSGIAQPGANDMKTAAFQLEQSLVSPLRQLAADRGVSLYVILLAVYNILLSRYGGWKDVVVGTPLPDRSEDLLMRTVGMFEHTMAVRSFPGKEKTFAAFLDEVGSHVLRASNNRCYPVEMLPCKLKIKNHAGEYSLFEAVFRLDTYGASTMHGVTENTEDEGIIADRGYPGGRRTPGLYKLALEAVDCGETMCLNFQYAANLYKKETIEALFNLYSQIVKCVVEEHYIKLADIELVSEDKKENIRKDKKIEIEFDF
ncbi:MAG: 30S ribosomal protein S4, partial [bacterium]|nr:30S ribosomal protein S4 [bacterium]